LAELTPSGEEQAKGDDEHYPYSVYFYRMRRVKLATRVLRGRWASPRASCPPGESNCSTPVSRLPRRCTRRCVICGSHEVDEDGDCLQRREPDVLRLPEEKMQEALAKSNQQLDTDAEDDAVSMDALYKLNKLMIDLSEARLALSQAIDLGGVPAAHPLETLWTALTNAHSDLALWLAAEIERRKPADDD
jgi:hypothetical protein